MTFPRYWFLRYASPVRGALVRAEPETRPCLRGLNQAMSNLSFINNRLPAAPSHPSRNGRFPDMGALFAGNWTWALATGANGSCWSPAPVAVASIVGSPPSFPICP